MIFHNIIILFVSLILTFIYIYFQVEERHDIRHYLQVDVQPKASEAEAINPQSNYSKCFDDDGRLKRTGTQYHQLLGFEVISCSSFFSGRIIFNGELSFVLT